MAGRQTLSVPSRIVSTPRPFLILLPSKELTQAISISCVVSHTMGRRTYRRYNVTSVPPSPTCLICGVQMQSSLGWRMSLTKCLRKDNEWKKHLNGSVISRDVMVPSTEIEAMHIPEFPNLTFQFCRAGTPIFAI